MMGDFKMMSCNDKACRGFGEDYKEFLSVAKTERECVGYFTGFIFQDNEEKAWRGQASFSYGSSSSSLPKERICRA